MKVFLSTLFFIILPLNLIAGGVILDMTGKVTVKLPDGSSPAPEIGMELPDGALVISGKQSSAAIMLSSGKIDITPSTIRYKVGDPKAIVKRTILVSGVEIAYSDAVSQYARGSTPSLTAAKMTDISPSGPKPGPFALAEDPIGIYFPKETKILYQPTINFQWKAGGIKWDDPVLIIDDKDQKHIKIIPLLKSDSNKIVSSSVLGFKHNGIYSWYLAERIDDDEYKGYTPRINFQIISFPELNAFVNEKKRIYALGLKNSDGINLLIGQLAYSHGLYMEAVKILTPLLERNKSELLKKLLFASYTKMGLEKAREFLPEEDFEDDTK